MPVLFKFLVKTGKTLKNQGGFFMKKNYTPATLDVKLFDVSQDVLSSSPQAPLTDNDNWFVDPESII